MIVAMFVDPYSADGEDKSHEYEEIEKFIHSCLPELRGNLLFKRGLQPYKSSLLQSAFKVYVFDIGGMCYVCHNGSVQTDFCQNVLKIATEDRPNSLFIPWSAMTADYVSHAVYKMFIPEPQGDEEEPDYSTKLPFNVWCPPKSKSLAFSYGEKEADIRAWLRMQLSMEQIIPGSTPE